MVMAPKATKAERLRQLRSWVLEHAATLRLREGTSLRARLRFKNGLLGEKSWCDFLSRNTFTAAEEAEVTTTFRLLAGRLELTPAKRQRAEDGTLGRLLVSPAGQAVTPSRTPAHLRTPPAPRKAPERSS